MVSGAEQLIVQAVEAEFQELLAGNAEHRTDDGKVAVVRNGYLPERKIHTCIGPVTVKAPKLRVRTGKAVPSRSALVVPYARKGRSLEAAVRWLHLKGVSSGKMAKALNAM